MSMPQEIVDKFQQYLDDWSTGLITIIQTAFPDLSPEEQQDQPILQSESFFAHCMFRAISKNYLFNVSDNGLYYTVDIELKDNDILFGNQVYVGKDRNAWTDAGVEEMNTSVFDNPPESFTTATGDIYAFIGGNCEFKLYAGGVYDYSKVRFKMGADSSFSHKKSSNYFEVYLNELTYTIDENSVVYPNRDYSAMNPWGSNGFLSIKNYPIIGNIKDLTTINNFITKMGATNNYTNTYTTPDNKTITVYYGDNYIITHVNDDEPVSYNDVKNALNIAVNQINDDNDTDMNVPDYPVPPDPGPDDDDTDGQDFGAGSSLGGSDMLWLLTAQQMSDFHTALNGGITTGFNPFDSIISVMGLAIPPTYILDDIEVVTNIIIPKSDGTSWSSGVDGHVCTSQKSAFGFVNLSLDRKYNNFLDFSPYSTHEIFIPMCGWLPLPDIAVNRTLCVYYVPDIQNCSVRGLVGIYGDGGKVDIIGEKYGAMGAEVPITNNGHALFVSGAISGGVQTLANGLNGVFGAAGTNNPWFGGSGLMSAIATGTQSMMNTQRNISSVIGQNQDRSAFSDGTHIMIKSSYPQIKLDPLYGHTHGFVCYRSGQLSEFSGFTICENPHISGITCTSDEKEEIKRLLESGVILPDGEGE